MNIIAIIQARMGSTRLPGKVMKTILGKPVLIHDLVRIRRMKSLKGIVVATTTLEEDDIIEKTVRNYDEGIFIYRGDTYNVLDRYYNAAKNCKADAIVRITSDCPLIDPDVSDKVVEAFMKNNCDYCCNNMPRTYPHGLDTEVFSFKSLENAWKSATGQYEKEHVTPYIREHPEIFKLCNVKNEVDLKHMRWTLDYPEDFEFIKEIYDRLGKRMFNMEDILKILKDEPYLIEINKKYADM